MIIHGEYLAIRYTDTSKLCWYDWLFDLASYNGDIEMCELLIPTDSLNIAYYF